MKGLWQRLTGDHARIRNQNEQESYAAFQRDRAQKETLIFDQMRQRRDLQAQIKAVRERHAAVFREIRHNQQHYRQMERDTESAAQRAFQQDSPERRAEKAPSDHTRSRAPTPAERLDKLRNRGSTRSVNRGRGFEPEC